MAEGRDEGNNHHISSPVPSRFIDPTVRYPASYVHGYVTRSEATVGNLVPQRRLGRLPVGVPGVSGSTVFSAIPRGCSFKRSYSLGDPGVKEVDSIFGIYSTRAFIKTILKF